VAVAAVLVWAPVGGADANSAADTSTKPPGTPTAHHFVGDRNVGALFPPGSSLHTCTASVVDSPMKDVLITAAHCISGTAKGWVFAPGYRDGVEPLGAWVVVAAYGSRGWLAHQDTLLDVAFLRVAPHELNGRPEQIQTVTGGARLGTAPRSGATVTVPAYAVGLDDEPLTCTARVYYRGSFPAFNCDPYVNGTSGAPWLERSGAGWVVVGVIGGLHQGGCQSWTSYSSPFGPAISRAESDAARSSPGSTFSPTGSDGCATGS